MGWIILFSFFEAPKTARVADKSKDLPNRRFNPLGVENTTSKKKWSHRCHQDRRDKEPPWRPPHNRSLERQPNPAHHFNRTNPMRKTTNPDNSSVAASKDGQPTCPSRISVDCHQKRLTLNPFLCYIATTGPPVRRLAVDARALTPGHGLRDALARNRAIRGCATARREFARLR